MKFDRAVFNDSVLTAYHGGNAKPAAEAANVIIEERVAEARRLELERTGGRLRKHEHLISRYVTNSVYVSSCLVPSTFQPANANARFALPPGQMLVRVEHIDRYLDPAAIPAEGLIAAVAAWDRRSPVPELIRLFIAAINGDKRDARPAFAAFLGEVQPQADAKEWPEPLCRVLGLGHYQGTKAAPLVMAQMRYGTDEIGGGDGACAAPTILDGMPSPYFHPSPLPQDGQGSGYALDVAGGGGSVREVVHRRLEYRAEHLYAVRLLDSSIALSDKDLMEYRIRHLAHLRRMSGASTFGDDLPGSTA